MSFIYCSDSGFHQFIQSGILFICAINCDKITFENHSGFSDSFEFITMDPNEVIIQTGSNLEAITQREYTVDASIPRDSPITDFFTGKTVFLTGPTGFLGHLFLEKLLR